MFDFLKRDKPDPGRTIIVHQKPDRPGLFGRVFGSQARERSYSDQFMSFADVNRYTGQTSYAAGLISGVRACVDIIIARCAEVEFTARNKRRMATLMRPAGFDMPRRLWYRQLYEQLLLTGNGFIWRDYARRGETWKVGLSEGTTIDERHRRWHLLIDHLGNMITREDGDGLFQFYLGYKEGDLPQLVTSPMDACADAAELFESGRLHLTNYSTSSNRVSGVFTADKAVTNPEQLRAKMKKLKQTLENTDGQYSNVALPDMMDFKAMAGHAELEGKAMEMGLREIAMAYHVPPQLLGLDGGVTETLTHEGELLKNAVYPLLDAVADGWSRVLQTEVTYDKMQTIQPTLASMSKALVAIMQTGIFTINEGRGMYGYDRLPGDEGDQLPATAGAPDRDEGGSDQGSKRKDKATRGKEKKESKMSREETIQALLRGGISVK